MDTLPSTDEGVAFLIQAEGKAFYHAGDLQLWPQEAMEDSAAMERQYHAILEPLRGQYFDAAFLMADPRQGASFAGGFDYFMRLTDTREAYPWDQEYNIDRLCAQDCTAPYRSRIRLAEQCCLHANLFSSLAL
ncbi:MAG: hypothetical protein LIO51_06250 [Clostridiales bacterium]|nr:hypothetical protein [Clostridiales bacterium]